MMAALLFVSMCGWLGTMSITIYAHRCLAHRALSLRPAATHVFRFILWVTTGTRARHWVAVHRKHHACADVEGDPHSPVVHGILPILFFLYPYYVRATRDPETIARYGEGCPEDWLDRNLYGERGYLGLLLLFGADVALFPVKIAVAAFVLHLLWVPWWAGVINGLGHHLGYRNTDTRDRSRNIVPLGLVIGGEELHNNHHAFPRSARFSIKWWEIDVSWGVIRALAALGLAGDLYVGGQRFSPDRGYPRAAGPDGAAAPTAQGEP
jgi:stearoyl-CoA desaturase (Delta-9 desaturase)